jgi:hypothetical protein
VVLRNAGAVNAAMVGGAQRGELLSGWYLVGLRSCVLRPLRWREVLHMLVARRSGHDELCGHNVACACMPARLDRMQGNSGTLKLGERRPKRNVGGCEIVALLVWKWRERERDKRKGDRRWQFQ